MTNDLASSYPTGEHLEGNFITYYVNNFSYFDRYINKMFGDRAICVDDNEPIADTVINWDYEIAGVVFSHIVEWAKMYSALIKDYEPLWNVDGTVVNIYGATERTDLFGATKNTDKYGEKKVTDEFGNAVLSNVYGEQVTSNVMGATENTGTDYKVSYPDSTELETDKHTDNLGSHTDTITANTYTDTHTNQTHTDNHTQLTYTDEHSGDSHTDKSSTIQHTDTETRTGNIGVTKSTELVESEARLRTSWNFYKVIFSYILKEMGCLYYD